MAWEQTGSIKGPKGDTGDTGPKGDTGLQGPEGPQGEQGAAGPEGQQGPQGPQGVRGEDGKSIQFAGSVPTWEDLPTAFTEADAGKGVLVEESGRLYVWSGTSFPAKGMGVAFQGPEGPEGAQGPAGRDGVQGPQGERGPQGPQGIAGEKGDTGDAGQRGSRWFTGAGAPSTIPGAIAGDMYLDTSSGVVYRLD